LAEHESLLNGERGVLELIAADAPLPDVLDALCRVIDEQSGLRSSIFLLDHTRERLTLAAGPRLPDVWRARVASFPVTTTACGAAVTRREQIISADIAADPLYAGYEDAANAAGFRAVWSTPFFSQAGEALGTFALYSMTSRRPDAAQLELVDHATHLASVAVERHLTEVALRESERRFSVAFYSSPACCTINRFADGHFLYVNDKFEEMFGYSRARRLGGRRST
jgi:PAS domain-containing protein